ncbi:hypothetical protein ACI77O_13465 [Pseudomonas tritici]|uniref:hypothetical protein n=1 Tax=Pseudomonas tritici TaxID=2745518 RepID=UPI00387B45EE
MPQDCTRESDFVSLFNLLWYRDYPVALGSIELAGRADWTTHIATTVRQVAGLLGIFSRFESGGRTDAQLVMANRKVWANLEWEWEEPRRASVGELAKLAAATHSCEASVFIGYSDVKNHSANIEAIQAAWAGQSKPLIVILISFKGLSTRYFDRLQTYRFVNDTMTLLREQPALPWCVPNTRWEAMGDQSE